jgi:hypothetical protein
MLVHDGMKVPMEGQIVSIQTIIWKTIAIDRHAIAG